MDPTKLRLKSTNNNVPKGNVSAPGYPKPRKSIKKQGYSSAESSSPTMMPFDNGRFDPPGLFNLIEASFSQSQLLNNNENSVNTNGGFITLRQNDPEVTSVQIPLPGTLKV